MITHAQFRALLSLHRHKIPKRLNRPGSPDGIAREYQRALRPLMARLWAVTVSHIFPEAKRLSPPTSTLDRARREFFAVPAGMFTQDVDDRFWKNREISNKIDDAVSQFKKDWPDSKIAGMVQPIAGAADRFQAQSMNAQLRPVVGVDVVGSEPSIKPMISDFTHRNVALIKTVPDRYFSEIEKLVAKETAAGTRWEDLQGKIKERFNVSESRAKLIARDQVSKFNGELTAARQKECGITQAIWRTANDNRVREEHEALNGEVYDLANPPEGGPGQPVQCRCYGDPVLESAISAESEPESEAPANLNPAAEAPEESSIESELYDPPAVEAEAVEAVDPEVESAGLLEHPEPIAPEPEPAAPEAIPEPEPARRNSLAEAYAEKMRIKRSDPAFVEQEAKFASEVKANQEAKIAAEKATWSTDPQHPDFKTKTIRRIGLPESHPGLSAWQQGEFTIVKQSGENPFSVSTSGDNWGPKAKSMTRSFKTKEAAFEAVRKALAEKAPVATVGVVETTLVKIQEAALANIPAEVLAQIPAAELAQVQAAGLVAEYSPIMRQVTFRQTSIPAWENVSVKFQLGDPGKPWRAQSKLQEFSTPKGSNFQTFKAAHEANTKRAAFNNTRLEKERGTKRPPGVK